MCAAPCAKVPRRATRGRSPRCALGHRSSTTISCASHSLSRVLFNFPSRYLSSIGLAHVFGLGRNSPPPWGCDLKQPDSRARQDGRARRRGERGSHPLRRDVPKSLDPPRARALVGVPWPQLAKPRFGSRSSALFARRYSGHPCWFLFLRLLICLTSAGFLAGIRHDFPWVGRCSPRRSASGGTPVVERNARGRAPPRRGGPGSAPDNSPACSRLSSRAHVRWENE